MHPIITKILYAASFNSIYGNGIEVGLTTEDFPHNNRLYRSGH